MFLKRMGIAGSCLKKVRKYNIGNVYKYLLFSQVDLYHTENGAVEQRIIFFGC